MHQTPSLDNPARRSAHPDIDASHQEHRRRRHRHRDRQATRKAQSSSGPIREHFLPPFPFPDPPPIPIPVVPPMPQGQGDAYVHVSSTLVDDMTEVLRETRLAQLTAVDQQHALVAYMCGLNEWLARDAHDRRVEVGGVLARMEDLTDWVREMRRGRDAFTSETDFESEEASTEGSEVPVHYPDMNDDYAQSGRRDPQRVYRTRNGYALYYSR